MIIQITTEGKTIVHPYPKEVGWRKLQDTLTGLIGNGCDHVKPVYTDLYRRYKIIMLADESGLLRDKRYVNRIASEIYDGTIVGNVLLIGEQMTEDGPDFAGLDEEQLAIGLRACFKAEEKALDN